MAEELWVVEWERWWDDCGRTNVITGPFESERAAEGWALGAWAPLYDPQWRVRKLTGPWRGFMDLESAIVEEVEGGERGAAGADARPDRAHSQPAARRARSRPRPVGGARSA